MFASSVQFFFKSLDVRFHFNSETLFLRSLADGSSVWRTLPPSQHAMSLRRPLKVSYREPSRDTQGTNTKADNLIRKCSLEAIVLVLHSYFWFLREEQIFKSSKWDIHGTSTGPSAGHPGDQIMGYFRDVLGTTVKHVF